MNWTGCSNPALDSSSRSFFKRVKRFLPLLLLFWAISLYQLTIVPRVYEDEPWQASTGWKLARDGVFGSEAFSGWGGAEERYYGYPPLHPLLLAAIYRAAGLGLFQTRWEPVALGLVTLALTYSLARRVFRDARIGWLAVLLLMTARTAGLTPYQLTGILFLDLARIARYDMLVPVFGLASLHAYLSARKTGHGVWYLFAGLLAGLAGLAHLYGAFWLPVLVLLALADAPARRAEAPGLLRPPALLLLGFGLPWLPYLAYVLGDLADWRAQTRQYGGRFDLLNPGWYLTNLLTEYRRYGPGLEFTMPALLGRVGFWSAVVGVPLALGALARRAWQGDWRARLIVVPALLIPALFALLLLLKIANYAVTFLPLFALAVAWGVVQLWDRPACATHGKWKRGALAALVLVIAVEGSLRVAVLHSAAQTTTPYARLIGTLRQSVPPGARVLGYHTFWIGMEDYDYRSFLVPLAWTDPENEPHPYPLDQGLERLAPDIVLLNERMRDYFAETAARGDANPAAFWNWLSAHHAELIAQIDDPTYGVIETYRIHY